MAEEKAKRKSSSASTSSKKTVKKAAPAKATTTVRTVSAKEAKASKKIRIKLPEDTANIVLAEVIGTFVLALVSIMTATDVLPLYIGLTFAALVMTIGAVSGAHVNPALSFGLWTARKIKGMLLPFYWGAQLLGAMTAIVVMSLVSGNQLGLDFSHFLSFDMAILWVELIGAAIFVYILTSVMSRNDFSATGKSLGYGFALFVGLIVAGSLLAPVNSEAEADYLKSLQDEASKTTEGTPDMAKLRSIDVPRTVLIDRPTLNPAVALATTESNSAEEIFARYGINDTTSTADTSPVNSRFGLEVIVATFIGAAIGANLNRLIGYRFKK